MTAVAVLHRDEILELVRSGLILREIAPRYGISPQAIHQAIGKDPAYQEARKVQAASMVEEAKQLTWAARDQVDIARAREISRFAFRYAESTDPSTWAPRSQVEVTTRDGDLGDRLRRAAGRTIEHESDAVPAIAPPGHLRVS